MRETRIHYDGPPTSRSREAEVEAVPQENARNFEKGISRVTAISRVRSDDDDDIVENYAHAGKLS